MYIPIPGALMVLENFLRGIGHAVACHNMLESNHKQQFHQCWSGSDTIPRVYSTPRNNPHQNVSCCFFILSFIFIFSAEIPTVLVKT